MSFLRIAAGRRTRAALGGLILGAVAPGCGAAARPTPPAPAEPPAQAAARILAAAEELERQHKTRQAFAAYHQLLRKYPESPESKQAAARVRHARQQTAAQSRRRPGGNNGR